MIIRIHKLCPENSGVEGFHIAVKLDRYSAEGGYINDKDAPFAVVYGSSQMGRGLHPSIRFNDHAERAVLKLLESEHLKPHLVPEDNPHIAVLYVELHPCDPCAQ
ncbi:MAG: hypothetical protein AAF558_09360 [Verrucomicrobiota bacterium]